MAEHTREQLITDFLDQIAELFDNEEPVYPRQLFTDPVDGETIFACALLERIRLGKNAKDKEANHHG